MNSDIILGAILAVLGGVIADEFRAWRERRRELKSIKVAVADELTEIEVVINRMHEVWEQAHVLSAAYMTDIQNNTTVFDNLRTRLFLIKDSELRRSIVAFYKKLKDVAKKSEALGSLADTEESRNKQRECDAQFQTLVSEAKRMKGLLE